ncbi:MAG: dioxygenase [Burkholderiaceae bacterium]|nr:dioxygenase [Burkholderiaceae bacterium]
MPDTLAPLFLSHGSPMTALEPREAGAFWQRLGAMMARPRVILAISAHSLTREPVLMAAAQHTTVHDFSGFPEPLYRLRYDAPGAPELAPRVAGLVAAAGLPVHTTTDGGLDHGIWAPLRFVWPGADIPVLPLAFPPDWTPARLFALGQTLAPLADEGVLVYGSGSLTHNLRMVFSGGRPPIDAPEIAESAAFRRWWAERSAAADWPALLDYRRQAPHGVLMHPTDEHLLPFYVAAGAGGGQRPAARRIHASLTYGCLAMDAYAFGPAAAALAQALEAVPVAG